ncbi:MAG: ATP synthase subunit I [Ruminococcus sp.]|nr:ATP synthase subunit I [Ruminococcus sp.]
MTKIDKTVIRETRYIAGVTIILSVIMEAVFLIIGMWSYKVLLGNILGAAVAVVNFLLMGITVQKAVQKDEKDAATLMKLSQTLRNMMLLIAAVLAIVLPFINPVAAIIPLFFPRIAITLIPLRDRNKNNGKENGNGE